MRYQRYTAYGLAALLVLGGAYLLLDRRAPLRTEESAKTSPGVLPAGPLKRSVANIYFADRDNVFLTAQPRILSHGEDPESLGRAVFDSVLQGPGEGLMRTLSPGASLRALYIAQDGTAYVDLTEAAAENFPGGCKTELLTVYSIVNSLVMNIAEIESVKFLIGGQEAMTLGGHLDLRFPFKANMLLIR